MLSLTNMENATLTGLLVLGEPRSCSSYEHLDASRFYNNNKLSSFYT